MRITIDCTPEEVSELVQCGRAICGEIVNISIAGRERVFMIIHSQTGSGLRGWNDFASRIELDEVRLVKTPQQIKAEEAVKAAEESLKKAKEALEAVKK